MPFSPPAHIHTSRIIRPKIELLVPVVSIPGSEQPVSQMNSAIRRAVRQLIEDQGSLADPRAEMKSYYEIKTNEKGVLSLSLFNYAFTGGAHGLTLQKSLTFMTADGQLYRLSDLFKPGSDYKDRLSRLINRQIIERKIDTLQPFTSIRGDQEYYVADRALVIWFSLYELTPYVYGFPYFPISVYDLSDIINESGPLGVMDVND